MAGKSFWSEAALPLLITAALAYYAFRLLVLHDVKAIRGKDAKPLKNEEQYTKEAGKLMLFLTIASLVMTVLLFWCREAALAEIGICIVIFGIFWKRMHDKYGE